MTKRLLAGAIVAGLAMTTLAGWAQADPTDVLSEDLDMLAVYGNCTRSGDTYYCNGVWTDGLMVCSGSWHGSHWHTQPESDDTIDSSTCV